MAEVFLGRAVRRNSPARLSKAKAKTILEDKEVRGHPLTAKQKRFFGFIAGGGKPTRLKGK